MTALILVTALGCGLASGAFFAFSAFVMPALDRLAPDQGIAAMQSINRLAVTPLFMTALFGTALLCIALIVWALLAWDRPQARWIAPAGALYLIGTIGVTIAANVPRNDALAELDPAAASSASPVGLLRVRMDRLQPCPHRRRARGRGSADVRAARRGLKVQGPPPIAGGTARGVRCAHATALALCPARRRRARRRERGPGEPEAPTDRQIAARAVLRPPTSRAAGPPSTQSKGCLPRADRRPRRRDR